MGHKVHPNGFRLGVSRTWNAKWYADRDYTDLLKEDMSIRIARGQATGQRQREPGGDRAGHQSRDGHGAHRQAGHRHRQGRRQRGVAAPGGGQAHDPQGQAGDRGIRQPELDAVLVAANIAQQLARRIAFRKAIKQAIQRTMKAGAKGVKISVSGRLGGAEMARREWDKEGRIPLGTLRADISYGQVLSRTTFGAIGVKVWIYRGDVIPERTAPHEATAAAGVIAGGA